MLSRQHVWRRVLDDAFVTKINAAGSAVVYSTYLGGSGNDVGHGIAVDSSGNAYVTGYTIPPISPPRMLSRPAIGRRTSTMRL